MNLSLNQFPNLLIFILSHLFSSFIQDSTRVLTKTKEMKNIGSALLVTMDVESLYTVIDHKEGLEALSHYLEKCQPGQTPPAAFILQLTEWILTNNVFLFQNQFYKQKKGTAMGACFSPNYSNLFMGYWEKKFLVSSQNVYLDKIIWWCSYIDDILLLLSVSESELQNFHSYLNKTNNNLKLSLDFSPDNINS